MRFCFSTGVSLLIYLEFRVKTCCAYLLMEIATCFSEYKNRHRHIYSLSCHKVLIGFVFVAKIVKIFDIWKCFTSFQKLYFCIRRRSSSLLFLDIKCFSNTWRRKWFNLDCLHALTLLCNKVYLISFVCLYGAICFKNRKSPSFYEKVGMYAKKRSLFLLYYE